jgi:phosphatidylinositol glycan class B
MKDDSSKSSEVWMFGSAKTLFCYLVLYRILNGFLVWSYFNPDEYWQSVEVAHNRVFGYGYLTWEWKQALRSYVHPLFFAIVFQVLKVTSLDTPIAIVRLF